MESVSAPERNFDFAVVGAGVFGASIAHALNRLGKRVLLVDAHGPGHGRSSSGGETRLVRIGYGVETAGDQWYSRWALSSLREWRALSARLRQRLFFETGVLWMARGEDPRTAGMLTTLAELAVPHERLSRRQIVERFPQFDPGEIAWGLLERESGVLLARRAVQALVDEAISEGVAYSRAAIPVPVPLERFRDAGLGMLVTLGGDAISAGTFLFACGPWLPKLFPDVLSGRIVPTRQDVFFFAPGPGDARFAPPAMPAWVDFEEGTYGVPDLESRGVKFALDRHGPEFDPDHGDRLPSLAALAEAREALGRRLPDLAQATLVETRVCQYENTSNGDFLIDRHPEFPNVWLIGGGSGHGFKHGPALGAYVAERLTQGDDPEPRFRLATKRTMRERAIF